MKKNNRGFLLAESLIVSTFVLTILILLYVQFSNLTTNYKNSYNYNNVESIYDLSSIANYLKTNNYDLSSKLTKSKPYVIVFEDDSCNMDAGIIDTFCDNLANKMDAKKIIYISSDISVIQKYVSENEDTNINQSLRDFITKVETTPVQNKGRLFAEFNNGTYATIVMDDSVTIPDDPITPPTSVKVGGQDVMLVSSGDGLYNDIYEEGKYTYKGATPNNYITFNNEMWRIISINVDGSIKIMRNESLSDIVFDSSNSNNWDRPADIKKYLNGEYLNSITVNKDVIIPKSWSIGEVTSNDLATHISEENKVQSTSANVGLITASEYIRANSNIEQCGTTNTNNTNKTTCLTTNWMYKIVPTNKHMWTLTPYTNDNSVYEIDNTTNNAGNLGGLIVTSNYDVNAAPVLILSSDITLTGTGTSSDPYKIGGSL